MKTILIVYQGGQHITIAQCLRCKECFTSAVPENELRPWDKVAAIAKEHRKECKEYRGFNSYG